MFWWKKRENSVIEKRYINERVAIFIDGSNMFHACNSLKVRIDYKRLIQFLRRDRWLLRTYFYTGVPSGNLPKEIYEEFKKQRGFLNELSNLGLKVKTIPLKKTPEGYIEKGIDILIATDMISLAFRDAYDTAILVSGDSDFVPVVEEIQQLGKRVENAAFKRESSYNLRKVCDSSIILYDYKDIFTTPLYSPKPAIKKPAYVKIIDKIQQFLSKKQFLRK